MQEVYGDDAATHSQPVHPQSKGSPAAASSARDSTDSSASTSSATSMPRALAPVLTGSSPFQQHQPASASSLPSTPASPATSVPKSYASGARTSSCSSPFAADHSFSTAENKSQPPRSTAHPSTTPQHPSTRALTSVHQIELQPSDQHRHLPPAPRSMEHLTTHASGFQPEQQLQQRVTVPPSTLLQAIAKEVSWAYYFLAIINCHIFSAAWHMSFAERCTTRDYVNETPRCWAINNTELVHYLFIGP